MISYFKDVSRIIWLHSIGHGLLSFNSIVLLPFLTLYMYEHFDENLLLTTLVIGVQPLTEIVLTIALSGVIDRWRRRTVLLNSLLFQFVAISGYVFAEDLWMFVVLAVLNGIGRFVYIPASRAHISQSVPLHKQTITFALLSTASSIGALTAPAISAGFVEFNHQLLFVVSSLLLAGYWLLCFRFLPREEGENSKKVSNNQEKSQSPSKILWWLGMAMLPISLYHAQLETNWPIFLKENLLNYLVVFSLLETLSTFIFIGFEVLLVRLVKPMPRIRVIQMGYLFYGISSLGFGLSYHIVGFILSQLMFCLGAIFTLNAMQTQVSILAPDQLKGKYFALFGLHWDISRSTGPFLGGLLMTAIDGSGLFITVAILLISGGILQTSVIKKVSDYQQMGVDSNSVSL
ncbi:MFS transporter [Halobacillus yeomjeoni]|uniref:MFS transporter n=1 Tax=Halobacillus yeomjeoni TaxID=311194 RepID=UPI001CD42C42|nr:MFS transporter [Halobacillus yeomjeoni]MCA0983199.1 MFS transporter [Halobacillus yeomjeoni]